MAKSVLLSALVTASILGDKGVFPKKSASDNLSLPNDADSGDIRFLKKRTTSDESFSKNAAIGATSAATSFCTDDKKFRAEGDRKKKCKWIAKNPTKRCIIDSGAELGCAKTCNPGCIGCTDDPNYKHNGKEKQGCEWVAKKPADRCKNRKSFKKCQATCNPICETRCTDNPDYRYKGNDEKTCEWVGEKAGDRCALEDNEAIYGCPATCNPDCPNPSSSPSFQPTQGAAEWEQLGSDIDGEWGGDYSGSSVSLSADGTIVAIGADGNNGNNVGWGTGHVRVYVYTSSLLGWVRIGDDIDGEAAEDFSGNSVSLSSDGTTVAIGAYSNDANNLCSGHVRVYGYDLALLAWVQLGDDIDGEAGADWAGWSVSLSADGTIVAIGAPNNDDNGAQSGHVRVYEYESSSWVQLGSDIDGEAANDLFGESVSLSSDGRVVAIAAERTRCVRLYEYSTSSNEWVQLGDDIDGGAAGGLSRVSVSLSADGKTVAIGAVNNYDDSGRVRVYKYDSSSWFQLGSDINGEAAYDWSGWSQSMSADGTRVAIGARFNNGNGSESGHVRVYEYGTSSTEWVQLGDDIDGEVAGDRSGDVSLSADGTVVAIGAPWNDGNGYNSGHTRVYEYN